MMSEGVPAVGPRIHRPFTWFDPEAAAVVTILLGLFQLMLSVLLAYSNQHLAKFYILPLFLGILVVAGGSFTMASERKPSRLLLRGCACSNLVGLLGAVIGLCIYCYSLSSAPKVKCVPMHGYGHDYYGYRRVQSSECPTDVLAAYCWVVTVLLILYDIGAVLLHSVLSFSAIKAIKMD